MCFLGKVRSPDMGNAANNGAGTCVNSPSPSNCKMALSVLHQKDLVLIQEFMLKWLTCSFLEYQTNKLPHIQKFGLLQEGKNVLLVGFDAA